MAGIMFRNRKYGSTLDASFTLYNGPDIGSADAWLIGDEVSVIFTLSKKQAEQINEAGFDGVRAYTGFGDATIHIKCIVAERRHAISWRSIGKFQDLLGTSVMLEASDGYWEDILQWVVLGKMPTWIAEDEPDEPTEPEAHQ